MKIKIAINGFGRIGRSIFRALFETPYYSDQIEVVAVNELADLSTMVHLLKYDSTFGKFSKSVETNHQKMFVDEQQIHVLHEKEIENLPWEELDVDVLLECTGTFSDRQTAQMHLDRGAKRLIFSHPADSDVDYTVIDGINEDGLKPEHKIVSNASCTSNCIVPIVHILDKHLTVEAGTITTIHSAMLDQPILDSYNKDLRKTRSAMQSIIPVQTELNKGIERILPHLKDKIETLAIRVPTTDVSLMDANLIVSQNTSAEEVNNLIKKYSTNSLERILGYSDEELVSCDFIRDTRSSIVDLSQTRVGGSKLVKVLTWFDNEWGYSNRMLDTTLSVMKVSGGC